MSMRFSEGETQIFVKLYLGHECLWNPEHEGYRMKFQRQEAFRDIITKFDAITNILMDERGLRKKVKNLKSTYSQELVKIKERSTSTVPFRSTIKWFYDWHKCFKRISMKRMKEERASSDDAPEPEETEDSSQKVWVEENEELDNGEETDKDPFVSPNEEDYILLLKAEPEDAKKEVSPPHKKKRKLKHRNPSLKDLVQKYRGSLDSTETREKEMSAKEDEFDIYGKYIASQLREMGLQRALRVQLQIQSIVSEARIEHLSSDQE